MVTSDIIQRTFFIRAGSGTGTAFTVDIDNYQYLVTAKHVISKIANEGAIDFFHEGTWKPLAFTRVWVAPGPEDLALISLREQLSVSHPITVAIGEYAISQSCYFLGFPFGMRMEVGAINNGFPIPFVKSAIISSFMHASNRGANIFLDGINNPGFSGGPVVTIDQKNHCSIIGVISAYRTSPDPIFIGNEKSGLTYNSNTGIIAVYGMEKILEEAQNSMDGAVINF